MARKGLKNLPHTPKFGVLLVCTKDIVLKRLLAPFVSNYECFLPFSRFAVKIVPLQLPDDVGSRILKYVFDVCEEINCHSVVNVEMVSGTRPWLEDFQTPNYEAARRAMLMVYREAPNMIREDKEIPTILLLQRVLDKSILLLPLAAEKSNANKPNENITKKQFFEGTKVLVAYLSQLAVV